MLNKSEKDFSSTTIYNDYVVSETQFHWQSQFSDAAPRTKSETPILKRIRIGWNDYS